MLQTSLSFLTLPRTHIVGSTEKLSYTALMLAVHLIVRLECNKGWRWNLTNLIPRPPCRRIMLMVASMDRLVWLRSI